MIHLLHNPIAVDLKAQSKIDEIQRMGIRINIWIYNTIMIINIISVKFIKILFIFIPNYF
jgi:TRAP-type C4-dicarboxylate transport system permease large subunit